MIHVSGNKLQIDKNEVEWSFPEEKIGSNNKVVASEEGTYQREIVNEYIIDHDFSGETIYFNPSAIYGAAPQGAPDDVTVLQWSCTWLFTSTGGYGVCVGGPPNIYLFNPGSVDLSIEPVMSGTAMFNLYDHYEATYDGWQDRTSDQCSFTLPSDFGKIKFDAALIQPDNYYASSLQDIFDYLNQLFSSSSSILQQASTYAQPTKNYDLSAIPYTTSNIRTQTVYPNDPNSPFISYSNKLLEVTRYFNGNQLDENDPNKDKLFVGIPNCPTMSGFATDSSQVDSLISHFQSTSTLTNINNTSCLANAEYGLTVSSGTTNLPVNVTTTTRIHLKNKNFCYRNESTSYPYIVQELTYLDSTNKGRKFERVINFKSSTASSCEWGTWWETSASKLMLTDSSQTITGNKTYLGVNNFDTTTSFQYGGIGNGTADANRHVWFNDDSAVGRPVKNDNFKYNPVTQQLQVGTSNNASIQLSECTLQYNSSSKSLSFNFN